MRQVVDVRRLLNDGADKVSINTSAVLNPQLVADASDHYGSQCIVVAIDAKQVNSPDGLPRWEVFTHGGRKATGIDAIEWAKKMQSLGAGEILLTSMDRDGTRNGFDIALTRAVSDAIKIPVIAMWWRWQSGSSGCRHPARSRGCSIGGQHLSLW